jgi:hypothetical protein
MAVVEIKSVEEFGKLIHDNHVTAVLFETHSTPMSDVLGSLSESISDIGFAHVDVKALPEIRKEVHLKETPSIFFYKDGKEAYDLEGSIAHDRIHDIINSLR